MPRFIKAELGLNRTVIYLDDTGRFFRFSGGTLTWRNHNPGNLVPGKVSRRNNQIGTDGKFAIFPDYDTGHRALLDCLRTTYAKASIVALVKAFAPEKDGNNVRVYTKFLRNKTGVHDDKPVKDFTPDEFDKLWRAIEQMEGHKEGTISEVHPITGVHKDRKGIYGYHIKTKGWTSKKDCVSSTKQGVLDLVICTSQHGENYLRARAGSSVNGSLSKMVVKDAKKEKVECG